MTWAERQARKTAQFQAGLRLEEALREAVQMGAEVLASTAPPAAVAVGVLAGCVEVVRQRFEDVLQAGLLGGVRPCAFAVHGCTQRAQVGDGCCALHAEAVNAVAREKTR
jgi:hypothetical protein